jgi:uncharacterized membrane protein
MKRTRTPRFQLEAWIMALLLPAIVIIGVVAGIVVQYLGHAFS